MSSIPQVATEEISDTELDNVSGGVSGGVAGAVTVDSVVPVSVSVGGGTDLGVSGVKGLVHAL